MSEFGHKHPIELLHDIEQQSIGRAKGLPQQVDITETWSGIGFRIGDLNLVAPLDQVNEILHYPTLTLVPGTKSWVKGVANIRGTLLPVMDLNGYLGKKVSAVGQKTRILVVKYEDMTVGIVVDEVMGLKHFRDEDKVTAVKKFDDSLRNYIQGAFRQQQVETLVFNMHALAVHPQFFQVAV
ncbi:MAG: chemotaxis protein CheW [Gammaproteobacteria bacterium]|jgi:twitching motility protein PilI|nr:chemotaxis protein CheW [Gammaproteobacteria bacterium]